MIEIRKFIENIVQINDSDWQLFASKFEKLNLKKKHQIVKIGAIENGLYFISKGVVRFYIPQIENDLTFGFQFENEFVSAYDSFVYRTPSEYHIETLTDSILWKISFEDLQEVYKSTHVGNLIGRKMAESIYLIKSKRELSLLRKTAEERYLDLFTERPRLIKEIPLKYIASYIGVTPQALSRIRKRIS